MARKQAENLASLSVARHVHDELTLAAKKIDKLATRGAKRRRRSADHQRIREQVRIFEEANDNRSKKKDAMQNDAVQPLIDPFTGARLFHIASHNLYSAEIVTRNIEAGYTWFMHVQKQILKSYASLASAIQTNLKDRIYRSFLPDRKLQAQKEADLYFADLHEFLDPVFNKTAFSSMYRKSHLKKSGGHLPHDIA